MTKPELKDIDYKYNIKVYWEILRKYKLFFFALMIITFGIEASHIFDNYLFKLLLDAGVGSVTPQTFKEVLLIVIIIMAIVTVFRTIGKYLHIHFMNTLDVALMYDLKIKFYNHVIGLEHKFHTSHKTGALIARLIRSGRSIERLTDVLLFNFAPLIFKLGIAVVAITYFSPRSALITIGTAIVFIIYSWLLQLKQVSYAKVTNDAEDLEKAYIGDSFTNIESVKFFGKEQRMKNRFADIATNTRKRFIDMWDWYRIIDAGQSAILSLGLIALVYFAGIEFIQGDISIGTFAFVFATFTGLIGNMFAFMSGVRSFYDAMADFETLFQYNKISNQVPDLPGSKNHKITQGIVTFQNITFSYGKRTIFKKFTLDIPKGQRIALVGHSGSGKSTLVKLLYRLYDVDSGCIQIDGRDVREYKAEWMRSEMSNVPQECALFDDTIYNNIAFSRPTATRKEVLKAMKFAQLDTIIKEFPEKEQTIVGERGVKLSGGEKQRVSIARAILADKRILVLDEATSALDSETEHEIQKDLEKLMQGRTSIIIAHRLSTIMKADTIVVLKKGKIIEIASHKDLLKNKGHYKKLWDLQKGGFG